MISKDQWKLPTGKPTLRQVHDMINVLSAQGIITHHEKQRVSYHIAEYERQLNDNQFISLLKRHGFFESEAVLDIGCGIGQTLWLISCAPGEKVGIDNDHSLISAGQALNKTSAQSDCIRLTLKACLSRTIISHM